MTFIAVASDIRKLFAARWDQIFVVISTSIIPFASNFATLRLRCRHNYSIVSRWCRDWPKLIIASWTAWLFTPIGTVTIITMLFLMILGAGISISATIVILTAARAAARSAPTSAAAVATRAATRSRTTASATTTARIRALHLLLPISTPIAASVAAVVVSLEYQKIDINFHE